MPIHLKIKAFLGLFICNLSIKASYFAHVDKASAEAKFFGCFVQHAILVCPQGNSVNKLTDPENAPLKMDR